MIVRPATLDDLPAYMPLAVAFHEASPIRQAIPFSPEGFADFYTAAIESQNMGVWLAEQDGRLIGICGALAYLASQQGDAVGISCVADGIVQTLPPRRNAAHLRLAFDMLDEVRPAGPTRLPEVLHELAETIRQRAVVVIVSDLFCDAAALASAFSHLRFRRHDVAAFQLLDPPEIAFQVQRPTRFLDMEGGEAIFTDPIDISDRYHRAVQAYLADMKRIVLESAVDYHRVLTSEPYEQAVAGFLVGRASGRGLR